MKKISRLSKFLSLKYANELDPELNIETMPAGASPTLLSPSNEDVVIPKPPLLPREFREETIPAPKETMRSVENSAKYIITLKRLAAQLASDQELVPLNPEQIEAIIWAASVL